MNEDTKKNGVDQKKDLKEALRDERSKVEKESAELIGEAAEFGPVQSIEEIEELEVDDPEDLIKTSLLLELKKKAKKLIELEGHFENIIYLEPSKLHEVVAATEKLLIKNSEEYDLYQRAGRLVRVTKVAFSPQGKSKAIVRPHDAVIIKEIDQAFLTVLLTKLGVFIKFDGRRDSITEIDCPERISRYVLAKQEWGLPVLTGIINTPTLRSDGSILDATGYDKDSGMLFVPGDCNFEKIPEQPTKDEAEQALKQLLFVIKEFPFEDDVSRSVAVAAILTVLIRKSIATAPLFGFTAPKMGSGKSLLADVVALIGTGKANSVLAQAENETEEKKRIMAVLIEGDQIVCYDNVERPFGSSSLCSVLTQREYKDRLLGGSETRTVLTNATFLATGNNLTFVGDTSTRVLLCKLDPQVERPEERSFEINLHQYIPENRGRFVRDGLTILRGYHVAGRPKQDIKQFGRFEDWSDWIRSALVWLGMSDPCESRKDIENADPIRILLVALFPAWYELFGDASMKIKDVIETAEKPENNDFFETLKEFAGDNKGNLNSRGLASKLRKYKKRIESGYRLEQMPPNQGTNLWRVKKLEE